jgi:hypothetical protein
MRSSTPARTREATIATASQVTVRRPRSIGTGSGRPRSLRGPDATASPRDGRADGRSVIGADANGDRLTRRGRRSEGGGVAKWLRVGHAWNEPGFPGLALDVGQGSR